jgi:predicted phosphodiesterase
MRFLILSDIHSNLEALDTVLEHASGQYDQVLCCGDLVGYGPDPNAVIERIRELNPGVIRGNHEKAALGLVDLSLFNPLAKRAALWTQDELTADNRNYLKQIQSGPLDVPPLTLVHGSLLDEDQYLVDLEDALQNFPLAQHPVTFFGHTHIQGGFVRFQDGRAGLLNPEIKRGSSESQLRIDPQHRYLVNPGAVGQPRDYDSRAAFVIYDAEELIVRYFRTSYPLEATQAKMITAQLPQYLIDRLSLGR